MIKTNIQAKSKSSNETASGSFGGSVLRRKCACRDSAKCECEGRKLERKPDGAAAVSGGTAPAIVGQVLNSPGQTLDSHTRSFMEDRLGRDFSDVRVHTDLRAAESARAVNALAYTVGRDVVFGSGQYSPSTLEGTSLIAHELTHVAQNTGTQRGGPITLGADDAFEAQADRNASTIARGGRIANHSDGAANPGRLSRAKFQVGRATVNIDYGNLIKVTDAEANIESTFTSWTGSPASTIHTNLHSLDATAKSWVMHALDLLVDNPVAGLDKSKAVQNLIAYAPSAKFAPHADKAPTWNFANEALSVSGWFEKAETVGLTKPTGTLQSDVQTLINPNVSSSSSSSGSSNCPSPRPASDQLDSAKLKSDLPGQLETYLKKYHKQITSTTATAQPFAQMVPLADPIQEFARSYYAGYADKGRGSGNTFVQRWQYSSHISSAQSPAGAPTKDKRLAYLDSRAKKVGGDGLFGTVHFDSRCGGDLAVLKGIVQAMEARTDIQNLLDTILRQKSYTEQTATPKEVILSTEADKDECVARWKTIKTMCHELMHVMAHPDFQRAEKGRQILTEGVPEVLGHWLYQNIKSKAEADKKVKDQMEAGLKGPCATIPDSTIEYKDAGKNAEEIRKKVGPDRFRAAFFLGQLEMIGLQPKKIESSGQNDSLEREAETAENAVAESRNSRVSSDRSPSALQSSDLVRGSGTTLDPVAQRDMRERLGHDFSHVRIHNDAEAAESAHSLRARAYTVGRDIVFGAGQYSPTSKQGRDLLAHELTHVVQQSGAHPSVPLAIADPASAQEQQAHAVENSAVALKAPASTHTLQINRAPEDKDAKAQKSPAREVIAIRLDHREAGGLGRFDTLLYRDCDMKVQFRMNFEFTGDWPNEKEKQNWQSRFISTVKDAWSRKFDLEATGECKNSCHRVKPFVEIYAPHTVPHVKVDVKFTNTAITSRSGSGHAHLDSLDLTPVKKGDITEEKRTAEGVKPMVPAVHEFGHLIGRDDQYAGASCAAGYPMKGIMCFGNEVTKADYEPFANALNQMTSCNYKPVDKA